jgi:predicted nucleic acid-binding protein
VTRFWDTSAAVPLLLAEAATSTALSLLRDDRHMVVWWGTRIEVTSALQRRARDGELASELVASVNAALTVLEGTWTEVQPAARVRDAAERLLAVHPLRAADALQLAAALVWSDEKPTGRGLVALDARLRDAARREGFNVYPAGAWH